MFGLHLRGAVLLLVEPSGLREHGLEVARVALIVELRVVEELVDHDNRLVGRRQEVHHVH